MAESEALTLDKIRSSEQCKIICGIKQARQQASLSIVCSGVVHV